MVVIAHQAIGVDFKAEAPACFTEGLQECFIVVGTMENGLPITAAIHYVVAGVFEFYPQRTRHVARINDLFYIINS